MTFIYKINRVLLQKNIKKFSHHITGKVLDVGSGNYNRYQHLLSCESMVCFDVEDSENVDVVGSVYKLPFEDNEFDSLISTEMLEHIEYLDKAISEMSRVLKAGGNILVSVPQTGGMHSEPYDYWRFTRYGLASMFERNGFKVVAYEQNGGFFSVITQTITRYIKRLFRPHQHWWGRIFSIFFKIIGSFAIWLDKVDTSLYNRKNTLGWVFVFKKI